MALYELLLRQLQALECSGITCTYAIVCIYHICMLHYIHTRTHYTYRSIICKIQDDLIWNFWKRPLILTGYKGHFLVLFAGWWLWGGGHCTDTAAQNIEERIHWHEQNQTSTVQKSGSTKMYSVWFTSSDARSKPWHLSCICMPTTRLRRQIDVDWDKMMGQFVALSAGQDALLDIYTKSWPSEHSVESSPFCVPSVLVRS